MLEMPSWSLDGKVFAVKDGRKIRMSGLDPGFDYLDNLRD